MMFFGGFKVEKIKPALKMSVQRIQLLKNKKTQQIKKSKKMVAELLKEGKEEKARITTEHIVREDFLIEAYDILELLCEVILERIRLLDAEKECPFDMREAVCTLIYAANRTEVKELTQVKEQLTKKYGKEFAERAMSNHNGCVNERIVHKLSAQPPNAFLVLNYMKELAAEFNVDWVPDETTSMVGSRFDTAMATPTGASVESGMGSGLGAGAYRYTDGRILGPGQRPSNFADDDIPAAPGTNPYSSNPAANGGSSSGKPGGFGGDDDGGDFDIPSAPSSAPKTSKGSGKGGKGGRDDDDDGSGYGGNGGGAGNRSSTGFDLDDIPVAPSGAASKISTASKAAFKDDPSSYGKDDPEVPDFDELTARFNALKKR